MTPGAILQRSDARRSHLIGILYDGLGRPMTSTHTKKAKRRYRYHVTREPSADQPAWRVSAHDIEQLVTDRIQALLLDRNRIARAVLPIDPRKIDPAIVAAAMLGSGSDLLGRLADIGVERIDLAEEQLAITIREDALLTVMSVPPEQPRDDRIQLTAVIARSRRGHELRLVVPAERADDTPAPLRDGKLVALLGEAITARESVISEAPLSINQIAIKHKRCRTRLTRLVKLSWMAPDLVRAIAKGSIAPRITSAEMLAADMPLSWKAQAAALHLA